MINLNALNPEYITDTQGNKKSVVFSISAFQELLEDIQDLVIIAERKNELTISHEKVINELKRDGIINKKSGENYV
jgi:hypothetical protein